MPPRPPAQSPSSSSSSPLIDSALISKTSNGTASSSSPGRPSIAHMIELSSEMTSNQLKRFMYFQQQRAFVKKLAEICEKLRYLEKEVCICATSIAHSHSYSSSFYRISHSTHLFIASHISFNTHFPSNTLIQPGSRTISEKRFG